MAAASSSRRAVAASGTHQPHVPAARAGERLRRRRGRLSASRTIHRPFALFSEVRSPEVNEPIPGDHAKTRPGRVLHTIRVRGADIVLLDASKTEECR